MGTVRITLQGEITDIINISNQDMREVNMI